MSDGCWREPSGEWLPGVGEGSRRGRGCDQPGWLQPVLTAERRSVPGVG